MFASVIFLLGLGAGALATPVGDDNSLPLQERGHDHIPWIASFANNDCHGEAIGGNGGKTNLSLPGDSEYPEWYKFEGNTHSHEPISPQLHLFSSKKWKMLIPGTFSCTSRDRIGICFGSGSNAEGELDLFNVTSGDPFYCALNGSIPSAKNKYPGACFGTLDHIFPWGAVAIGPSAAGQQGCDCLPK